MTEKLLVIFKDNWADEMDIEGFDILSEEAWNYKKLELEHTEFPQEIYFGTNEENSYDDAGEFLSMFKIMPISDEEEEVVRKFFGKYTFGTVPFIEGNAPKSFYEKNGYCPD